MDKDLEKLKELSISLKNGDICKDHFFDSILDLNAQDYLLHFNKAIAYNRLNKIEEAIQEIEKAISRYSLDSMRKVVDGCYIPREQIPLFKIYFLAGELYAKANNYEKSLDCYQKYQYFISRLKTEIAGDAVVYSFRKYSEYSLADLINNEITVVHPSLMNDPFDSIANLWCTPKNLEPHCKEKKHLVPLNKSYDYFRIRSFAANTITFETDEAILKNILMWSHYTDGHKGFCVKYRLSEHFVKQEKNDKFEHMYLKPIKYLSENDEAISIEKKSIEADLAYATKYGCWKYENEIRLISYNISTDNKFLGIALDNSSKIEAVYFGYNCTEKQKETISCILSKYKYDIKLYNIRMNPDSVYDLSFERYEKVK